jgi:dTDP-4-amino-4,6-dideoxygalactose transaminase
VGKLLEKRGDLLNKKDQSEMKPYPYTLRLLASRDRFYRGMKEIKVRKAGLLIENLKIPYPASYIHNHFFPFTHSRADLIRKRITRKGYESTGHFSEFKKVAETFGYEVGMCPNAERIADELFTVPVHPGISDRKIRKLTKLINSELSEDRG